MDASLSFWLVVIIFGLTYVALALGKVPWLRVDRAGIALIGATLTIVTGVLPLSAAVRSINYEAIILLFGMMVVVAYLRLSGFFVRLADSVLSRFHTPRSLLAVTIAVSGTMSAFLVNDIVCLALTPLVIHIARRLRIDPVPQLIGLATAANIGSTATLTGNPQNMIIGVLSHISYLHFAVSLAPVAALGLVIDFFVISVFYRRALGIPETVPDGANESPLRYRQPHLWLFRKSLTVTVAAIILFFLGVPVPLVALVAAAVLLLGRVRPQRIYSQIDWTLLVMFCGLFVVVHAFEVWVIQYWGIEKWRVLVEHPVGVLSVVSALLSNLVSNVPAVLLFKPVIPSMPVAVRESAWLALAMSSTLAGNLTILGSIANLIVVENAQREKVSISVWDYCRVGIPTTILTLSLGIVWLYLIS